MKKHVKMSVLKRILAVVLAAAVAVSILTVPDAEVSAATGKVKSVAVTNLPAKQLTLKKGKSFTLKTKVSVSGKKVSKAVTYKTSNKKVATVNAKGKITAKKKGTATITVYSKADKKKTCKIKVTVGTPVTKVKLNKTKANLNVGKSLTLKTTLSPKKPSNKGIIWKSSNTKIATVTSKGVVKAKKAGTVKITATAKDGSGKKATCKITVKKAAVVKPDNPAPVVPLSIQSMKIVQDDMMEVTFTKATALTAADFNVWAKRYENADYLKKYTVSQVTTTDSITYKVYITGDMVFGKGLYIKVEIPKLQLSKECVYMEETYNIENSVTLSYKVGATVKDTRQRLGTGYANYSISGLPAGIQYEVTTEATKRVMEFSGSPRKAGVYNSVLVYEDEIGSKYRLTIRWIIYDENNLIVCDKEEGALNTNWSSLFTPVYAYGGSGSYTYEIIRAESDGAILDNCKIVDDLDKININATGIASGVYKIRIRVTDKNDATKTGTGTLTFTIVDAYYIRGIVRDANGDPIEQYCYSIINKNKYAEYSNTISGVRYSTYNLSTKKYEGTFYDEGLESGIYDITISDRSGSVSQSIYNLTALPRREGQTSMDTDLQMMFDVTLPVYKIKIEMDPNAPEEVQGFTKFATWHDVAGSKYYNEGTTQYLPNGIYHLSCTSTVNGTKYVFYVDITVNGSNTTAYAYVKE
uniref:Ig-like domain-containing protein n=1 Tax=Coprococcus sp. TaxID=2049024 RepID=UPI003FEDF002